MFDPKLKEALGRVQKPGRYTGGEPGSVYKDKEKVDVLLCDHSALKGLDALTVAFLDTNINADGVANVELGLFSLDAAFRDNLQCVHFESSICF